jgi:outer membrane protein assembly factor BamB
MNNVVYVGSDDGKLYAINTNNGTLKWNYDMGKPVAPPQPLTPMTTAFLWALIMVK